MCHSPKGSVVASRGEEGSFWASGPATFAGPESKIPPHPRPGSFLSFGPIRPSSHCIVPSACPPLHSPSRPSLPTAPPSFRVQYYAPIPIFGQPPAPALTLTSSYRGRTWSDLFASSRPQRPPREGGEPPLLGPTVAPAPSAPKLHPAPHSQPERSKHKPRSSMSSAMRHEVLDPPHRHPLM